MEAIAARVQSLPPSSIDLRNMNSVIVVIGPPPKSLNRSDLAYPGDARPTITSDELTFSANCLARRIVISLDVWYGWPIQVSEKFSVSVL